MRMSPTESALYRSVFFACCLLLVLGVDIIKVFLADGIRRKLTLRKVMYLQKISAACLLGIGIFLLLFTLFGHYFKEQHNAITHSQTTTIYNTLS